MTKDLEVLFENDFNVNRYGGMRYLSGLTFTSYKDCG
jgi:hypothetical protein